MHTIKLIIEYNGANFCGWQQQPGVRTIQEELTKALRLVLREDPRQLTASGRTDSGVHARAQVVSFKVEQPVDFARLRRSISHIMKGELAIRSVEAVPDDFNARFSAKRKHYRYTIINRDTPAVIDRGFVWTVHAPLDIERMQREARSLEGHHDFKSFQAAGCAAKTSDRDIYRSELTWNPPYLVYDVVGSGFLKQMVRNIVGTLVEIGKGRSKLGSMQELIAARDRLLAGPTAPAYGLCLIEVEY